MPRPEPNNGNDVDGLFMPIVMISLIIFVIGEFFGFPKEATLAIPAVLVIGWLILLIGNIS
jgi:hypothetical protein